jgi:glycosyltransferase involved in cell wall biosynthesis
LAREPLVSIIIPAYNAEAWISNTLQSAIGQTWKCKEILVINDGSMDHTADIVSQFASKEVALITRENGGLSEAVNHGLRICQGDYIQELDADDLLSPRKIENQLTALRAVDTKRTLLSSPWAYFYYRTSSARFVPNSLWQDLSPVEWLLRKMGENLHMQNATWLVSRELATAAGPWDARLRYDQDGEYFARVLLKSDHTRFVSEARVFYRATGTNGISYIGNSNIKKDSLALSMKLHVQYLRSLEESERVRKACLRYLQQWYEHFYPERPDLVAEMQGLAAELQGSLEEPCLHWKYAWMRPVFGWQAAKWAQLSLPQMKASFKRCLDRAAYRLVKWKAGSSNPSCPAP